MNLRFDATKPLFGLPKRQLSGTLGAITVSIDRVNIIIYHPNMNEKLKVQIQENIKKIESGSFNENDVGMLYVGLRQIINKNASLYENTIFELSNFIMHGDCRDIGIMLDTFVDFYHMVLYLFNYALYGANIDITKTFPSYIKNMCQNKLNRMTNTEVKKNFKENKKTLKRIIEKSIILDDSNNAFIDKTAPGNVYNIIYTLFQKIPVEPIFTDDSIMESLKRILDINKIKYNRGSLFKQKDKIILSILVHIHHTNLKNKLGLKIHCHIYYNIDTNNLSLNLGFLMPNNEWIGFMYEAISTKLSIHNYCSSDFLEKHNADLWNKNGTVFNSELGLNKEFKLEEKRYNNRIAHNIR